MPTFKQDSSPLPLDYLNTVDDILPQSTRKPHSEPDIDLTGFDPDLFLSTLGDSSSSLPLFSDGTTLHPIFKPPELLLTTARSTGTHSPFSDLLSIPSPADTGSGQTPANVSPVRTFSNIITLTSSGKVLLDPNSSLTLPSTTEHSTFEVEQNTLRSSVITSHSPENFKLSNGDLINELGQTTSFPSHSAGAITTNAVDDKTLWTEGNTFHSVTPTAFASTSIVPCQKNKDCPLTLVCQEDICLDPCQGITEVCGINALCKVRWHRIICSCPNGYGGDPQIECVSGNNMQHSFLTFH